MTPPMDYRYLETSLATATPEELILKIYDGLILFATQASKRMHEDLQDIQGIHDNLRRAQRACALLMGSLNFEIGGELSTNLFRVYEFWHHELVMANMQRDVERVDRLIPDFKDYRQTWGEAIKQFRAEKATGRAPEEGYVGIA